MNAESPHSTPKTLYPVSSLFSHLTDILTRVYRQLKLAHNDAATLTPESIALHEWVLPSLFELSSVVALHHPDTPVSMDAIQQMLHLLADMHQYSSHRTPNTKTHPTQFDATYSPSNLFLCFRNLSHLTREFSDEVTKISGKLNPDNSPYHTLVTFLTPDNLALPIPEFLHQLKIARDQVCQAPKPGSKDAAPALLNNLFRNANIHVCLLLITRLLHDIELSIRNELGDKLSPEDDTQLMKVFYFIRNYKSFLTVISGCRRPLTNEELFYLLSLS